MKDSELLNIYVGITPFLASVCGPGSEVVVHDVTDPLHSLIAISNPISGREVGDPLTDFAMELQKKGTCEDEAFISGYSGKSKGRNFLSSTYFIKNEDRLIGMLCINKDMTSIEGLGGSLAKVLEQFGLKAPESSRYSENLDASVVGMVHTRIADVIKKCGVSPDHMTMKEKIAVVKELDDAGILMMKGAVAEIAQQLSVSVPTIYRYLNISQQGRE